MYRGKKDYEKAVKIIRNYFKEGEKVKDDYSIGLEIEHFVLKKKNYKAVSYYESDGIADILKFLAKKNRWEPLYENENIIGLKSKDASVSLEPGGQVELSISPQIDLKVIEKIYLSFLQEIIPLLEKRDYYLVNIGYQPLSLIKDIPLLPKKRYKFMYDYFKNTGTYAHNMMKGTASLQVNLDYSNEKDYVEKFKIANFLSPLIYYVFDNSPFFEGKKCNNCSIRAVIWDNCDDQRCGFSPEPFDEYFGYDSYAEYLLNIPPIFIKKEGKLKYTGNKLFKEIFDPHDFSKKEIDHIVTMAFPDVRTKQYIEIRMGDSLPYPYSLGYAAFWKGLFYNQDNLNLLYRQLQELGKKNIISIKRQIKNGNNNIIFNNKGIYEYFQELFNMAEDGLEEKERDYLYSLKEFIDKKIKPKDYILQKINKDTKIDLNWCVSNNLIGK
ncbi:MAG: glutamate--cysteine ligase [Bacillota bacterium]